MEASRSHSWTAHRGATSATPLALNHRCIPVKTQCLLSPRCPSPHVPHAYATKCSADWRGPQVILPDNHACPNTTCTFGNAIQSTQAWGGSALRHLWSHSRRMLLKIGRCQPHVILFNLRAYLSVWSRFSAGIAFAVPHSTARSPGVTTKISQPCYLNPQLLPAAAKVSRFHSAFTRGKSGSLNTSLTFALSRIIYQIPPFMQTLLCPNYTGRTRHTDLSEICRPNGPKLHGPPFGKQA